MHSNRLPTGRFSGHLGSGGGGAWGGGFCPRRGGVCLLVGCLPGGGTWHHQGGCRSSGEQVRTGLKWWPPDVSGGGGLRYPRAMSEKVGTQTPIWVVPPMGPEENDRQTSVKTLLSLTSFAGGKNLNCFGQTKSCMYQYVQEVRVHSPFSATLWSLKQNCRTNNKSLCSRRTGELIQVMQNDKNLVNNFI